MPNNDLPPAPRRAGWRRSFVLKLAVVAVGSAIALWVALGVTLTLARGRSQPAAALALWPGGAASNAALAGRLVMTRNRDAAPAFARKALEREPVNVLAVRALGLHAAVKNDQRAAARLFAYSETLSRRDVPTQLWLIETSVARNDIDGALRHYDRALRTSLGSRDVLLPVLARAAGEPGIGEPLSRLVASRPAWWSALIEQMVADETTSPAALALMLHRLRLDPRGDYRWLLFRSLNRLVQAGDFERAHAIYREARGPTAAEPLLRDGDFSAEYPIPPFDWTVQDQPGLTGVKEARTGAPARSALSIVGSSERTGEVARQLLLLQPGSYRLSAMVGEVPDADLARPTLSVMCVEGGGRELARMRFPAAGAAPAPLNLPFVVPQSGCRAQWVRIDTGTSLGEFADARPWITSVSLRGF